MDSAAENIPPMARLRAQVRLKWCGKSAPRILVTDVAVKTQSGARPNRETPCLSLLKYTLLLAGVSG